MSDQFSVKVPEDGIRHIAGPQDLPRQRGLLGRLWALIGLIGLLCVWPFLLGLLAAATWWLFVAGWSVIG